MQFTIKHFCLGALVLNLGCGDATPEKPVQLMAAQQALEPAQLNSGSSVTAERPTLKPVRNVAQSPPLPAQKRPRRSTSTSTGQSTQTGKLRMDKSAPVPSSAGCNGGLRGVSSEFPWAGAKSGGIWQGTGHDDPEPLKKFSNKEMLAKALDTADQSDERQHALVSIGRRKMQGAIDALEIALSPKESIQIREMGLSGLIEHGGQRSLELMWQTLKQDKADQIRGMAIWGIALYGADETYKAVQHGLKDSSNQVKGMAILATWAMKDYPERVFPIIEDAASASEQALWQEGLYMLGRMPYPRAKASLERIARASKGEKKNSAVVYYRNWLRNFPDLCK